MGRFSALVLLAVLSVFFNEVEASKQTPANFVFREHLKHQTNPFVYNYERLRIGGLVFTCLLVAGNKCKGTKKTDEEAGQI
nr:FXYD domain-containing ion transport regulator 11-like isoform X2 [Paramormyrops kingsleyae]